MSNTVRASIPSNIAATANSTPAMSRAEKAATTRRLNYARSAKPKHLQMMREAFPNVPNEELMADLRWHEDYLAMTEEHLYRVTTAMSGSRTEMTSNSTIRNG